MKIYIPKHLREVGIFRDLARMITAYEENYVPSSTSFDDYQSFSKIDPVLRFVSFCISKDQVEEDYESILEYVTRMFYSVRGTRKVFEYMRRYLGIVFKGEPVYTVKTLSFSIENQSEYDASLFSTYLIEFLNYLLYFESINYKPSSELTITEDIDFYCGIGLKTYKLYRL